MILEMHCHTAEHSSCSHAGAAEIAQRNFDIGLHGTVITDHHYLWPPEEIEELRRKLKVPDYYLILSGQEVSTPELGDVLVYGADVAIEKGTRLASIRNHFPDAAIVWAHPYRQKISHPRQPVSSPHRRYRNISSNHTVAKAPGTL
jgi:hypothetical protein